MLTKMRDGYVVTPEDDLKDFSNSIIQVLIGIFIAGVIVGGLLVFFINEIV